MRDTPVIEEQDSENKSGDDIAAYTALGVFVPLLIIIGLGLAVAAGMYSNGGMRVPAPANAASVYSAQPGVAMDVVVQVTGNPVSSEFDSVLLSKTDSGYKRSTDILKIALLHETSIIMGQRADIWPGAVLQVRGTIAATNKKLLVAKRVVMLTGFVSVH